MNERFSIVHISAVFGKQIKDMIKNFGILILFFIFPVLTLVFTNAVPMENAAGNVSGFFMANFASIHVIFAPIVSIATIIAEEKEKGTLRTLLLSNIKAGEYLCSVGGFVFLWTVGTACLFIPIGGFDFMSGVRLLAYFSISSVCSVLVGSIVGICVPNTMTANAVCVPVAMLLGFLPMLAGFNDSIKRIAQYTYGYSIFEYMLNPSEWVFTLFNVAVLVVNFILFAVLFALLYRKNKLR